MKAIILAAGLGTRFKSEKHKVLHEMLGKPIIWYVLNYIKQSNIVDIALVVSHKKETILEALKHENVLFFEQANPKGGTADALLSAKAFYEDMDDYILVTNGDAPLVKPDTIKGMQRFLHMVEEYEKIKVGALVLSSFLPDPTGYGRIVKNGKGDVIKIVEEKEATYEQKQINEVNGGVYMFYVPYLKEAVKHLKPSEKTNELYITDIIEIMTNLGYTCRSFMASEITEIFGVNDRWELSFAESVIKMRILENLARSGVTIHSPESVYIEPDVQVELDAEIFPNVVLKGNTVIHKKAKVMNGSYLENATIKEKATVLPMSYIKNSTVEEEAIVGPMCHIRDNSVVGKGSRVGSFVELKNAKLQEDVMAKHLSYLGDVSIGKKANIGAGTVVANFDGKQKYQSYIGQKAFIGSNSLIIAPRNIGDFAFIAGGSVITKDIPPKALAIERAELKILEDKSKVKDE